MDTIPRKRQNSRNAHRKQTAEKRDITQSGTPLAIILNSSSCSLASGDTHVRGTWGGARNRAARASRYLTRTQCEGLIAAVSFAERTARIFGRHWTVHFERAGCPDSEGAAFVGKLLSAARRDVRRAGGELAALWVRENGHGKGGHVHILLALPDGFSLRNRTRKWIVSAGGKYRKGVSKVRIIGGTLTRASHDSARHRANVGNVLAYLLKAASLDAGKALGLARYGEGGKVIGKRCGRTQNIGAASRTARC